jgi:hypothetical protein
MPTFLVLLHSFHSDRAFLRSEALVVGLHRSPLGGIVAVPAPEVGLTSQHLNIQVRRQRSIPPTQPTNQPTN